jgi:UDP-glucose:(heptosyl)LPS alpha-1,3-glucosyltransferase
MTQRKHIVIPKANIAKTGGLEKQALEIAKAFAKKGHRVTILTTGDKIFLEKDLDISVVYFSSAKALSLFKIQKFDHDCSIWLKRNKVDVILGMDKNTTQTHLRAGNGIHFAFLKSRRYAEGLLKYLTCLANPLHQTILQMEKRAYENKILKKIFTNSHMIKSQIQNHYNISTNKIEVIHNGVEFHKLDSFFDKWEDEKSPLKSQTYQLLFIGNGYRRKGLYHLLQALSCIKNEDFHLNVIGKDKHLKKYIQLSKSLKLDNKVSFLGPQKNIYNFYQLADCLVLPTFYDPFANVTVEALAMGLFVITSKDNGGHEILTKDTGIILDDQRSINNIATALKTAFNYPKTLLRAKSIRNTVKHLDFEIQLNKLTNSILTS